MGKGIIGDLNPVARIRPHGRILSNSECPNADRSFEGNPDVTADLLVTP